MSNLQMGVVYEPEQLTSRRKLALPGVALELVQVPPVAHAFTHLSQSHLLMFTESGKRADGESRAEGQNVSTMRDTSGTINLIPAGCGYGGWTIPVVPARYLSLAIDPKSPISNFQPVLDDLWNSPIVYARRLPKPILATIEKLRRTVNSPDQYGQLYGEALTNALMVELVRWLRGPNSTRTPRGGLSPRQLRIACDFIRARFDKEISLASLGELCDLSPNHFATAFRNSTGMPPHQYQLQCRMDFARSMLTNSRHPVIQIALMAGFSTPSAFAASFRRCVGMTPRDYRRAIR